MDTEKCRALLRVIETGSLSSAAQELGYTPSGMSRMMASLEDEFGFKLLLRHHGGVSPTPECSRMLPSIRELDRWSDQCSELAAEINGLNVGTVTVGTAYVASYAWLSSLIVEFHTMYPNIEVRTIEGTSCEMCKAMEDHQADMCIISQRDGQFKWFPLIDDPIVAWLPKNHPLADLEAFPVAEFANAPFINTYPGQDYVNGRDTDMQRVLDKYGIVPNTKYSTTNSQATFSMVAAGLGISLNNRMNSLGKSGCISLLPLDPPQIVSIGIALSPDMSPAAKKFADYITSGHDFSLEKWNIH